MKCPVCQANNADNASSCVECHSDLEAFIQIKFLDDQISSKSRTVMLLSVLIGVFVIAGGAFFVNMNSTTPPADNSTELKTTTADNLLLQNKVQDLSTQLEAAQESIRTLEAKPAQENSGSVEESSEPVSDNKIHTVQEGESLWSISANYYGDGQLYSKLLEKNKIQDPDLITIGQTLML